MLLLAIRNLSRRKLRTALTLFGVSIAVMTLASLLAFGEGYQRGLRRELDGMGIQMMLVPLGCPYDAAARVLKGRALEFSLPQSALAAAKSRRLRVPGSENTRHQSTTVWCLRMRRKAANDALFPVSPRGTRRLLIRVLLGAGVFNTRPRRQS